jgi:hypothetical protein
MIAHQDAATGRLDSNHLTIGPKAMATMMNAKTARFTLSALKSGGIPLAGTASRATATIVGYSEWRLRSNAFWQRDRYSSHNGRSWPTAARAPRAATLPRRQQAR